MADTTGRIPLWIIVLYFDKTNIIPDTFTLTKNY